MKKVSFMGWKNCIEMKSGDFRIIVTTEVGPRVIGGFLGKSENIFNVDKKLAGKKGGDKWVNYGGHRLWHSPETYERTYSPDNSQIQVFKLEKNGVGFAMPVEPETGISKTINIYPMGDNTFRVEHCLRNDGVWDIELAPWAISVMAPGGVAVAPHNFETEGLLPTKFFAVWPYTKLTDKRISWGDDLVMLRQDPKAKTPAKIGLNCECGWVAYVNKGVAFVKQFDYYEDEDYPDNGCNVELYTCKEMLEAESLGPLSVLAPGDEVIHVEEWIALPSLIKGDVKTEDDAAEALGLDVECECCCDDDECSCTHDHGKKAAKKAAKKTAKASGKKAAKKAAKKK